MSLVATVVLGTGALVWGLVAGSRVMIFDGVYTLTGIALTWVSMIAANVAAASPTAEYPFGRHGATPLAISLQGAALLGTVVYGLSDAMIAIAEGGSATEPVQVLLYGLVSATACLSIVLLLRVHGRQSDLVRAELVSWQAGLVLSGVFALGGAVAIVLPVDRLGAASDYVDPLLVIVASFIVLPLSLRLVRSGIRELLEAAPERELADAIDAAIDAGTAAGIPDNRTLPAPTVRATKLGRRVYVDVDFTVEDRGWSLNEEDQVRRAIAAHLNQLGYRVWAAVKITADR